MFKKVLLLSVMLTSLSLSVAATQVEAKSFDSVKFVVESVLDNTSNLVLDNEPVNSTLYTATIENFTNIRSLNVTGESTQLVKLLVGMPDNFSTNDYDFKAFQIIREEVGWQS